jgi:hypothetical protein
MAGYIEAVCVFVCVCVCVCVCMDHDIGLHRVSTLVSRMRQDTNTWPEVGNPRVIPIPGYIPWLIPISIPGSYPGNNNQSDELIISDKFFWWNTYLPLCAWCKRKGWICNDRTGHHCWFCHPFCHLRQLEDNWVWYFILLRTNVNLYLPHSLCKFF